MTTKPVQVRVSQATRLFGSSRRQASRMASEIWSAILSGCPSVTDSEVNKKRLVAGNLVSPQGDFEPTCEPSHPIREAYGAQRLRPGFGLIFLQNGTRDDRPKAMELASDYWS